MMRLLQYDINCLHEVKEAITKHPEKTYSLASLAQKAGINEHKLKNGFKQLFGKPVFIYRREQRLLLAKNLLEQTDLNEAMIAKKVGFKSLPNFIKAFKK